MKLKWAYELELQCRNFIKQIKSSGLSDKIRDLLYSN